MYENHSLKAVNIDGNIITLKKLKNDYNGVGRYEATVVIVNHPLVNPNAPYVVRFNFKQHFFGEYDEAVWCLDTIKKELEELAR